MIPKFRAWDKRSKEMWKVSTLHIEDEYADLFKKNIYENPLNDQWAKFEDIILMQSTGLKDKNGVESWEGNYLSKEGCWPFFIKWIENEGCLMAVPVNSVQRINWKPGPVKELLDTGYVNNSNIYETPELLEEENNG